MCSYPAAASIKENNDLYGILEIGRTRNFSISLQNDVMLVCKPFWRKDYLDVPFTEVGANFTEKFSVLNSNQFLEKVKNNYLSIEIVKQKPSANHEEIGFLRLPLHQFFIAYRDATLTSRLKDSHLPVISANTWIPVFNSKSGTKQIGELECLLAMGTERQIQNIGILINTPKKPNMDSTDLYNYILTKNETSQPRTINISDTSELLDKLQQSFNSSAAVHTNSDFKKEDEHILNFILEIKSARNLPLTQSLKMKKKLNRTPNSKGSHYSKACTGEEPSTYVTFPAEEKQTDSLLIKSHEGMVYSTAVISNNRNPVWNKKFYISTNLKYVINKKEGLVLKVWKKNSKTHLHGEKNTCPCPIKDSIIGFTSINLHNLIQQQLPELNNWLDIVDFSGHIHGQINIGVKLLGDMQHLKATLSTYKVDSLLDTFETSLDINNASIYTTIQTKFAELEQISERLRVRLSDVTDSCEDLPDKTDEQVDEFEHDINTSVEEDQNEDFFIHMNEWNSATSSSSTQ